MTSPSVVVVLRLLEVMRHLYSRVVIAAFDVEGLVSRSAVQDVLVAANALADRIKSLDHLQSQTSALDLLGDGDLFDVADESSIVDAGRTCKPSPRMIGV